MEQNLILKNSAVVIDEPIGPTSIVHHAITRKYFQLGVREAGFLASLTGVKTSEALRTNNCGNFNAEEVDHLLAWFGKQGLLAGTTSEQAAPARRTNALDFIGRLYNWRIHLFDPNAFLDAHIALVHSLFSRMALFVYLTIFLLPIGIFIAVPDLLHSISTSPSVQTFSTIQLVGVYVAMLMMVAIHEMSHAIACKHFGGEVHKIGIMFMFLQPVMYCDISDSWRFDDVEKKLTVAAAGIFAQILVSCLAVTIWSATGWPILLYFAGINALLAVFNFFPFVKLDGYWMMVHMLNEPNLRMKSLKSVDAPLRKLIYRLLRRDPENGNKPWQPTLFAFGLASIAAVILFWGLGLYTIHKYAANLSENLATMLTAVFVAMMAYRLWNSVLAYIKSYR
jgi:putative peptide zinc metalloprotease protein